jgi:hypothetical protein
MQGCRCGGRWESPLNHSEGRCHLRARIRLRRANHIPGVEYENSIRDGGRDIWPRKDGHRIGIRNVGKSIRCLIRRKQTDPFLTGQNTDQHNCRLRPVQSILRREARIQRAFRAKKLSMQERVDRLRGCIIRIVRTQVIECDWAARLRQPEFFLRGFRKFGERGCIAGAGCIRPNVDRVLG